MLQQLLSLHTRSTVAHMIGFAHGNVAGMCTGRPKYQADLTLDFLVSSFNSSFCLLWPLLDEVFQIRTSKSSKMHLPAQGTLAESARMRDQAPAKMWHGKNGEECCSVLWLARWRHHRPGQYPSGSAGSASAGIVALRTWPPCPACACNCAAARAPRSWA